MIKFECQQCGKKIGVKDEYAGKRGRCPGCKTVITVPKLKSDDVFLDFLENNQLATNPPPVEKVDTVPSHFDLNNQPIIKEDDYQEQEGNSKLPWFLDAMLYPLSLAGIINLAIFSSLPLIRIFAYKMLGPLCVYINIILAIVNAYFYLYLVDCIRDSASGKRRACVLEVQHIGWVDIFWPYMKIAACALFFIGPALAYRIYFKQVDYIFWSLIAYGLFFSPIAFLGVVLHDSFTAFNPLFLFSSIMSTFISYCGLLLMLTVILVIMLLSDFTKPFLMGMPAYFLRLYFYMVAAHLTGLFFWRNEEKLCWEV